jgi:hypothetical protein
VTSRRAAAAAVLCATAAFATGCQGDGCVGGDDGSCVPPTACPALRYACGELAGTLRVTRIGEGSVPLEGPKARGTTGDILLENDLVRVVLDAPSHPSALAPTGGSILDLAPVGDGAGDQINSIYQAGGLLPRDAVHYDSYHIDEHTGQDATDMFVAVVFRGRLEGDSRVTVVTRYELRACEPGVRVRTDLYNGAPDPNTLYLADGFLWGDHSAAPFVPGAGLGFRAPKVDLLNIDTAWREWPFLAARTQAPPDTSYAVIPCDRTQSAGFNDPTLTAAGLPLGTTLPGDGIHFERFIVATAGRGLAPAAGEALRVRAMVHGEPEPVTVTGRVVAGGVPISGGSGRAASLLFYEPAPGGDPDDPARRTPWSEAVPRSDGQFSVALPADRRYRVQPYAFGLPAAPATSFVVARDDVEIGDVTLTASAHLTVTVTTVPGQPAPEAMTYAELVLIPFEPPMRPEPPSLYGLFPGCDPMLGPPHGGSPACNRALAADGRFDLLIPPGEYYVYATRGPFATIDRARITVAAGSQTSLPMVVQSLPMLLPPHVLSGDFHVHGAASYDSSMPDQDRIVSFLAAGLDVVIATDHDVATDYAGALGAITRIKIIPGVEQTPNIPWFTVPGEDFPQTLGHFNFWPLGVYRTLPRNGVPWDELREPGQMLDDIEAVFAGAGVRQLNHPFAGSKLGRDQGLLRAIEYDPRTPIVAGASFAADFLLRTPGATGGRRNLDWDVQEVMNGASLSDWLRFRAFWFSLLSQGIVRAGTANSDSHSLALEQVGYPRNLVFGDPEQPAFDLERFNDDVRRGHMVGTNGPILDVTVHDGGNVYRPGLDPIQVTPDATLHVTVSAAPWIPVSEVRVIVNGRLIGVPPRPDRPIDVSASFSMDHLGAMPATLTLDPIPLATVLARNGGAPADAWLIVEAGLPLPAAPDTDGDGLPDLSDASVVGRPDRDTDPRFDFHAIAPRAWPAAFTNPFLIDVDGNGWKAPGLAP